MNKQFSFLLALLVALVYFFYEIDSKPIETPQDVKKNEKYYQTIMCDELGGSVEYVLQDKTRIDCLTSEYAIEVDFAKKWAEGIGQSLYYAQMTGKKPAVGLIVAPGDEKYLKRLEKVAKVYNIKILTLQK